MSCYDVGEPRRFFRDETASRLPPTCSLQILPALAGFFWSKKSTGFGTPKSTDELGGKDTSFLFGAPHVESGTPGDIS